MIDRSPRAAEAGRRPRPADLERLYRRLQRALDHAGNTHGIADVMRMVQDGRAQWWGDEHGAIVTELVRYPRRLVLRYWLAAGERARVLALEGRINEWARREGADLAVLYGRRGWQRLAVARGWRPAGVILMKELGPRAGPPGRPKGPPEGRLRPVGQERTP